MPRAGGLWAALLLGSVVAAQGALAAALQQNPALGRYEGRVIVTGTDLRSRPYGFATTLADVLVKVSGDPTLAGDPRLPKLTANAAALAQSFDYWDRMSGIPHHDSQGSEDRPYNMTVRYDPAKVDAALAALGRAPWPDPRPALVVLVRVQRTDTTFDLTRAEPRAEGMRAALVEAGQKYGMNVIVPSAADLAAWQMTADLPVPGADAFPASDRQVALRGSLVLSEAALGWVGTWHVSWHGQEAEWRISGVNFDAAFRSGVAGAMQVLSGHGVPQSLSP